MNLSVVALQLQLCISTSSWSDGFSLDTVGSYGCVRCPATNMDFLVSSSILRCLLRQRVPSFNLLLFSLQVGVSIQMSSFNLTRIVTLSPFYTLVNKSSYELEVGELISQTSIRWHYIPSSEVS